MCLSSVPPPYVHMCLVMQCVCLPCVISSYLHSNTVLLSTCCVSYKASTYVLEAFSVEQKAFICGTSMENMCNGKFCQKFSKNIACQQCHIMRHYTE